MKPLLRRRSARSRLALLVITCVIPSLILSAVVTTYYYQHERQHLIQGAVATVRSVSDSVDRDLAGIESALIALGTSPSLADGDFEAFHAQARTVLPRLNADNIYVTDADGQQLVNTLKPYGSDLPRTGNMLLVHRVFIGGGTEYSDLLSGAVAQQRVVAVGVPVYRDGKVIYMLAATLQPQRLVKVVKAHAIPEEWIATVLDGAGTIVARTRRMEHFLGHKTNPGMQLSLRHEGQGAVELQTSDGIPSLGVFSRSALSGWTVVIYIPRAELSRQLWFSIRLVLLINALALGISLGLAWRQGGKIARAIRSLVAPALALGRSEKVAAAPSYLDEVDQVSKALQEASDVLAKAQYEAHHDRLTGLANRALFDHIVERQIAICQRNGRSLTILYIDLDGFKAVNDAHGHGIGDELLREVSGRLAQTLRKSDVAARLGGDEFAAILIDTGPAGGIAVSEKLIQVLSAPYDIQSLAIEISASIGVATFPDSADGFESLVLQADEAMYAAKSRGKNGYVVASV